MRVGQFQRFFQHYEISASERKGAGPPLYFLTISELKTIVEHLVYSSNRAES